MRQRDVIVVDRATGGFVRTVEVLPDASLAERIAELKAVVPPDLGPGRRICGVRCDGCDIAVRVDYDNPRLPVGWVTREGEEFCPTCA